MTTDVDGPDLAERVRDTVRLVPGVVRLHAGLLGEVATHLPGRTVPGVRVRDQHVEVHVVVAEGADIRTVATQVRRAASATAGVPVHVRVEDLAPATPPELEIT